MFDLPELEWTIRLLLGAILGGLIGLERERIQRPAGLRTHMLVSLGATLFTILSLSSFGSEADPSRIAGGIVTGIGFLGAGTVIQSREWVRGLTTAAGLWTVAAIGMACGVGRYELAISSTIVVLAVLFALRSFAKPNEEKDDAPAKS